MAVLVISMGWVPRDDGVVAAVVEVKLDPNRRRGIERVQWNWSSRFAYWRRALN